MFGMEERARALYVPVRIGTRDLANRLTRTRADYTGASISAVRMSNIAVGF